MGSAKGDIVTLLVILAAMGAGYSLLTSAPKPVRQVELTAVWATLALIAAALLGTVNPAVSLLLAGLVIAPLWYATLHMCDQHARAESESTAQLWREWRTTFDSRSAPTAKKPATGATPLARQIDRFANGVIVEEIEITQVPEDLQPIDHLPASLRKLELDNLELAPLEELTYRRGRIG